ncbi:MAG: hypothetical protein QOC81_4882 [Thermoanaerobaculia bacterium]|jgi:hypothetical protein|nr:hypothetical protein [Thermoanaerobaculia bacterium]
MTTILHIIPSLTCAGAESQLVNLVRHTTSDELTHIVCAAASAAPRKRSPSNGSTAGWE